MRQTLRKGWLALVGFAILAFPAGLLAVDIPFDTTPERFQGQDRLVNFLNKFQTALIIVLVILFALSFVKMVSDYKAKKGIKEEAVGMALCVFGIIVVSNPAYWINLIASWFGS